MPELADAYAEYQRVVGDIAVTGRWGTYADLFTDDAVFRRPGTPDCRGRDAIRAMILTSVSTLPGSLIQRTELLWHSLDLGRGLVVQELRHTACDPGDGSVHAALATSMLAYAGGGLWSGVDVVHNPSAYRTMYRGWARAAERCGRQDDAAQVLLHLTEAQPVI